MQATDISQFKYRPKYRKGSDIMRILATSLLALMISYCSTVNSPLHPVTAISSGELSALQQRYDVRHYALSIEVFPDRKFIQGKVSMTAMAVERITTIELDFDPRFTISSAAVNSNIVAFDLSAGKLRLETVALAKGEEFTTTVIYQGRPYEAENPPWDGGFVWSKTASGEPWIATAVQGRGCDLYWPCKDHISDKPERGVDMTITVPAGLTAVMNGNLISQQTATDKTAFHWRTSNPISAYHLAINIGPFQKYELQHQNRLTAEHSIPVVFYHITDDTKKIDKLMRDDFVNQLEFYERVLGPYPWGNEKIGLVEIPYLGMEHQTMNGYGNEFRLDPDGFDWLIQHEFAHEWFGNLMTQHGSRDFWLHEGFANYMQPVYAQEVIGQAAYWSKMWSNYNEIESCKPTVPSNEVDMDYFESNDPYYKGSWTLHTLRWLMREDKFWRAVRRLIYDTADPWTLSYPIKPTRRSTEDFIAIASDEYGEDLSWFFAAYLFSTEIPSLEIERGTDNVTLSFINSPDLVLDIPVLINHQGNSTLVSVRSDGTAHAIPPTARLQIDPQVQVFREFGTAERCSEDER